MVILKTPLNIKDITKLKIGDNILLNGTIFTARDKAHQFLLKENFENTKTRKNPKRIFCAPEIPWEFLRESQSDFLCPRNLKGISQDIRNSIIYHCGPIIKNNKVISAGPTTSARMNPYTPKVIEKYSIKAIIGKGGMDNSVLDALKGKAVYLSAIGGCGVLYAKSMTVKNVYKKEFGMPEAIWEFEVKDFPAIVTMDSKGNSLYEEVYNKSREIYNNLKNNS